MKLAADSDGSISRRSFMDEDHNLKQVKQMVHGQYALLEESGSELQLTRLGKKIDVIEDHPCEAQPRTGVVNKT